MTQPATQIYDSQDESQSSYYSVRVDIPPPPYTLTAMFTKANTPKIQYDLDDRFQSWSFGREEFKDSRIANDEQYFYIEELFDRELYMRFSRKHFIIERMRLEDNNFMHHKPYQFLPVVITPLSLNGLYINDEKIRAQEKRILQHNDVIMLNRRFPLFRFRYRNAIAIAGINETDIARKYFIGDTIGTGGYGEVHIIYGLSTEASANDMQKFAMKIITTRNASDRRFREKVNTEAEIMSNLNHVNVLQLVEHYTTPDKVIMVLPMMWGGDLLHRILTAQFKRLNEDDSKFFFLQILRGLQYMHKLGIAHRDIKCDNILLYDYSPSPLLKISDFGLSKVLGDENTICGTKNYSAPEILNNNVNYTTKVDIWSAGVVLYAMISGTFPFHENLSNLPVSEQIKRGIYQFPSRYFSRNQVSKYVVPFIRSMLIVNPSIRSPIEDLLNHSWMRCPKVNKRLEETYSEFGVEDTLTDEQISQDLQAVDISDASPQVVHVAKRPRIG